MQNASEAGAEPTASAPESTHQAQGQDETPDPAHARGPREAAASAASHQPPQPPVEIGGPAGPEPTRFGDWERKGRCIDF
jgi:hypothetical protein